MLTHDSVRSRHPRVKRKSNIFSVILFGTAEHAMHGIVSVSEIAQRAIMPVLRIQQCAKVVLTLRWRSRMQYLAARRLTRAPSVHAQHRSQRRARHYSWRDPAADPTARHAGNRGVAADPTARHAAFGTVPDTSWRGTCTSEASTLTAQRGTRASEVDTAHRAARHANLGGQYADRAARHASFRAAAAHRAARHAHVRGEYADRTARHSSLRG
jgi:hypothetical protein